MPAHREINIRFLRRLPNGATCPNPRNDDILRIQKLGENSVRVIYAESTVDGRTIDVHTLSYHQLWTYLIRTFWLLALDEDPFASVQLAVPGYPCVLLTVARLQQQLPQLMEILMSSCVAWAVIGRYGMTPTGAPPAQPPQQGPPQPQTPPESTPE